ncbi:MAG: MmgE/PrpD family protein [Myxococcota bacterium]|nr:MmgE/PrpD family protein [Myxococcota bacterium]
MGTKAQELARFIRKTQYKHLDEETILTLKRSLLDTFGVAIAAIEAPPLRALRVHANDFNPTGTSTLIGDGRGAPDIAAFYNAGLIGYLDFQDGYMARNESAHPSMILGGILAALEYRGGDGKDLLTAMAIGYQIIAKMCDQISARACGLDRTLHTSTATAAAVGKILDLDEERLAHAIAISATSSLALRSTRTGSLSDWTHMAVPDAVRRGLDAAFLAMRGITGPSQVFEGSEGIGEILGVSLDVDWEPGVVDRVSHVNLRKYNADIHAQSAIEMTIQLRAHHDINPENVTRVEVETFDLAHELIGGGNGDDRTDVMNREEAARSLPFLISAALLDGKLDPSQYRHRRIRQQDMQEMTDLIEVSSSKELTEAFPEQLGCKITIHTKDGESYSCEKTSYSGHHTKPMSWEQVIDKFTTLTEEFANEQLRSATIALCEEIEKHPVDNITRVLARVEPQ